MYGMNKKRANFFSIISHRNATFYSFVLPKQKNYIHFSRPFRGFSRCFSLVPACDSERLAVRPLDLSAFLTACLEVEDESFRGRLFPDGLSAFGAGAGFEA